MKKSFSKKLVSIFVAMMLIVSFIPAVGLVASAAPGAVPDGDNGADWDAFGDWEPETTAVIWRDSEWHEFDNLFVGPDSAMNNAEAGEIVIVVRNRQLLIYRDNLDRQLNADGEITGVTNRPHAAVTVSDTREFYDDADVPSNGAPLITVPNGTVVLDMAGHKVDVNRTEASDGGNFFSMFGVPYESELIIRNTVDGAGVEDISPANTGVITVANSQVPHAPPATGNATIETRVPVENTHPNYLRRLGSGRYAHRTENIRHAGRLISGAGTVRIYNIRTTGARNAADTDAASHSSFIPTSGTNTARFYVQDSAFVVSGGGANNHIIRANNAAIYVNVNNSEIRGGRLALRTMGTGTITGSITDSIVHTTTGGQGSSDFNSTPYDGGEPGLVFNNSAITASGDGGTPNTIGGHVRFENNSRIYGGHASAARLSVRDNAMIEIDNSRIYGGRGGNSTTIALAGANSRVYIGPGTRLHNEGAAPPLRFNPFNDARVTIPAAHAFFSNHNPGMQTVATSIPRDFDPLTLAWPPPATNRNLFLAPCSHPFEAGALDDCLELRNCDFCPTDSIPSFDSHDFFWEVSWVEGDVPIDTHHRERCLRCGYVGLNEPHIPDQPATCYRRSICTHPECTDTDMGLEFVFGEYGEHIRPADQGAITITPATCIEYGTESFYCDAASCDEYVVIQTDAPTGSHTMGGYEHYSYVTCVAPARERAVCTAPGCDYYSIRDVGGSVPFGHDFTDTTNVRANEDNHWIGCANEGCTIGDPGTIEEHTYDNSNCEHVCDTACNAAGECVHICVGDCFVWEIIPGFEPECDVVGLERRICTFTGCNHYIERMAVALGCDFDDGSYERYSYRTCTDYGMEYATCTRADCDEIDIRTIPAEYPLGHDMPTPHTYNGYDGTYHFDLCQREGCDHYENRSEHTGAAPTLCGERAVCDDCDREFGPAIEHEFGEFGPGPAATCVAPEMELRVCSECGEEDTRPLADSEPLGHDWGVDDGWVVTKPATCLVDGERERVCLTCNEKENEVIEAPGHDMSGEWKVIIALTCGENGLVRLTCADCDHYIEEETPATGGIGNFMCWFLPPRVGVEPTCGTPGRMVRECVLCNYIEELDEIPENPDAHVWDEFVPNPGYEPTCFEPGVGKRICGFCGYEDEDVEIPATGNHTFGAPEVVPGTGDCVTYPDQVATCTTPGCTHTDDVIPGGPIGGASHTWGDVVANSGFEPTCWQAGVGTKTCEDCSAYVDDVEMLPTGNHTWAAEATAIPDTGDCFYYPDTARFCTTPGCVAHDTIVPGELRDEPAHTWQDPVPNPGYEPTCWQTGVGKAVCALCDYASDNAVIPPTGNHAWGTEAMEVPGTGGCLYYPDAAYFCITPGCTAYDSDSVVPGGLRDEPNHAWGNRVTERPATCTTAGLWRESCANCAETREGAIAITAHNWTPIAAVNPTCVAQGRAAGRRCTTCNLTQPGAVVLARGHAPMPAGNRAATFFATGIQGRTICRTCNQVLATGRTVARRRLGRARITLRATGNRRVRVSARRVANANRYQFQFRRQGTRRWRNGGFVRGRNRNIPRLTAGRNYQFRVRAARVQGRQRVNGRWSAIRRIRVR